MTSLRESLYTKAQIGSIQFEAASASGGGKRRLAIHEAIGVDGATIEDLGEAPRVEHLSAHVGEDVYLKLENLRREATVQTCTHPLFGTFQGRIHEISYEAGTKHGVNIKLTLIEDGQHALVLAPVTLSLPSSAGAFAAGLDDWGDINTEADFESYLSDESFGIVQGLGSDFLGFANAFDTVLDAVQSGTSTWAALGSALDDLGSSLDSFVDGVYGLADEIGQAGMDIIDASYSLVRAARDCVDAAQSEAATILQPFKVATPVGVAALCREFLGSDDDDMIDLFLESNPTIIDLNAIPSGLDIVLPVAI